VQSLLCQTVKQSKLCAPNTPILYEESDSPFGTITRKKTALPLTPSQREGESTSQREGKSTSPPLGGIEGGLFSEQVDSFDIAGVLLNKGHIEEAINELHQKLAADPNFAPAHTLLGRAYANLGRWSEARRWCESALKLEALQPEAYYVLALVHQHKGRYKLAVDTLKKAIYLERDNPLFHFNLATLYKNKGQIKKARRACQNVIRILEKWPSGSIVPDTGGATAKHLLEAAKRIMNNLETE